ncbi:Polyhomeotic-like protein 2 [Camelus dromedarius]|uniref:Polyhomeotic-like protein 2 n=1 Tax=Camelus dromedarius TaxID=9838 RepID=A0A5N4DCV8_CAMDR|nr:Polyhomeotic-like protein 2 [Camelus dromedarius]
MENELPAPHTSSSASVTSSTSGVSSSSGGGSGRPTGPQISVYSGIPDRQTVQVIQQALHRQPSTAAQYLQQMYAAQQQHLMLQTAALQQQHLSSAQLQSLAAVQQINLAASPAAAQLINRAQSVNSAAASGIAQQAVLLGNTSSPALTASQAQMYLRAQMLIFTPTATVATVQPELGTGSPARPPTPAQGRNTAQGSPAGAKPGTTDSVTEPLKKVEGNGSVPGSSEGRAGLSRMVPAVATHPLIAPAYAQLQPHQLLPQPSSKHLQPQFVIQQQQQQPSQQQPPSQPSRPGLQAQSHPQLTSVPPSLALQPSPEAHAMPLGPVSSTLPLQCSSGNLHKPGSTQQAGGGRLEKIQLFTIQLMYTLAGDCGEKPGDVESPLSFRWPGLGSDLPCLCFPAFSCTETGQGIVHALTDLSSPGMTSGNGNSASSITGTAPQNGENKPPQAIVKPQILTHVIEGFVIQEGAEPFPVGRSSLLVGNLKKKYAQGFLPEKLPQQDHTTTTDSEMEEPYLQESKEEGTPLKLKCELCGRVDFAYKFKRSKRFCSMACAKRYNVGCTKRVGLFHSDRSKLQKAGATTHNRRRASKTSLPTLTKDTKKQPTGTVPLSVTAALQLTHSQEDSSRCSDNSSYEEPLSPISASSSTSRRRQGQRDLELPDMHMRDLVGMGHHFLPSEPTKWNVEDVYEFIRSLPGCQEIAEEFRAQEIDGQALLLLKEDHLMSAMNIKLGPALKIYARISMLKDS